MPSYDPYPSASIDGRRRKFAQREAEMRRSHHAQRLDRIRKTRGLLGPTLAIGRSDPTFTAGVRKVSSEKPVENMKSAEKTAQRSSVFASQTQDLESKNLKLLGEAEMLCEILESAIGRGDLTGTSLVVELSLKVLDEITLSRTVFNAHTHTVQDAGSAGPSIAAFSSVLSHEKTLLTLSEIVATEQPEPLCQGKVESYAFSPAHDSLMCVVENEEGKHLYPVLKLDYIPRVGEEIAISWDQDAGVVRTNEHIRDSDTSRRIKPGS